MNPLMTELKRLMREKGINKKTLAFITGRSYVSVCRKFSKTMTIDEYVMFCHFLGASPIVSMVKSPGAGTMELADTGTYTNHKIPVVKSRIFNILDSKFENGKVIAYVSAPKPDLKIGDIFFSNHDDDIDRLELESVEDMGSGFRLKLLRLVFIGGTKKIEGTQIFNIGKSKQKYHALCDVNLIEKFLKSNLTIEEISKETNMPATQLSNIIFNPFIKDGREKLHEYFDAKTKFKNSIYRK